MDEVDYIQQNKTFGHKKKKVAFLLITKSKYKERVGRQFATILDTPTIH